MRTALARSGAVAVGLLASVALSGSPASAHVTVSSTNATQGGYAKLTFRVPNEKDASATTVVEVNLPPATPIASVSIKPLPGWTAVATKSKLDKPIKNDDGEITEAITKIVWTATADAAIAPGQFQEFDISAGPLPAADTIVFKALQTYADGETVRWIEEPGADGKAPEHPAPTLKLAKSGATAVASSTATAGAKTGARANDATSTAVDSDARAKASLGLGFGIAALILALIGVAVAGFGARRRGPTT